MEKLVSVIIVTYNSEKHIYDCLDSLFTYNDIGDAMEVIIVDNQSTGFEEMKRTLEKKYVNKITIIANDRNGGYGQGNNVGVKASSAPFIMIMNPDVRLVMPVFKTALKAFENPKVVQFGMRCLDKDGKTGVSMGISSEIRSILRKPIFTICNKYGWFFLKYFYLIGACFFIRKSSFAEINYFDERIFMFGEEDDIHYRLLKHDRNSKIVYNHKLCYQHLHGLYSEPKKNDYSYEKQTLKVNLLVLGERGMSKKDILNMCINDMNVKLLKARTRYLLHHAPVIKDYIVHLIKWRSYLRELRDKGHSEIV